MGAPDSLAVAAMMAQGHWRGEAARVYLAPEFASKWAPGGTR